MRLRRLPDSPFPQGYVPSDQKALLSLTSGMSAALEGSIEQTGTR
jgi:hypothetical protein